MYVVYDWRKGESPHEDKGAASKVGWMDAGYSKTIVVYFDSAVLSLASMFRQVVNISQDQGNWVMKLCNEKQLLPTSFSFGNV